MLLPVAASLLSSGSTKDTWMLWSLLIGGVLVAGSLMAFRLAPSVAGWWDERRSKAWPTVSAEIVIAVVDTQQERIGKGTAISNLAMLTYRYHTPELQTGDYVRQFPYKEDAQQWANSCKGQKVTVHIDPHNPARSILRTKDLDRTIPR